MSTEALQELLARIIPGADEVRITPPQERTRIKVEAEAPGNCIA